MPSISIKSRLMLMLLFVSIAACSVLIYIGYHSGKASITETIFKQLTGIRAAKQYQVESYFDHLNRVVEILGENESTTLALLDFKKGFQQLGRNKINAECTGQLSGYYENFVKKLSQNMHIEQSIDLYYPNSPEACYLQYEYIIDNPHPSGKKHLLNNAGDASFYNEAHKKYHDFFTKAVEKFGFYDLFLVDIETGDVLYSVFKETDFATNLYDGPYRKSNLARLARKLNRNSDINTAQVIDFDLYRPSYGAPAAFIGIPLRRNSIPVGALMIQLPVDEINKIMTDEGHWEEAGLGKTGEIFLVGEDKMMRSVSRPFLQDTTDFIKKQMEYGTSEEEVALMYTLGTTILQQRVAGKSVEDAFQGEANTEIIENYLGTPVLGSYSKLKIGGLNWAILAEIDLAEAFLPVENFTRKVFTSLCVIILAVTFLSILLAGRFLRPIVQLTEGVRKLKEGDLDFRIKNNAKGEFGELAENFNGMMIQLNDQKTLIEKQTEHSDRLIHNFLPKTIAGKIRKGEKEIASKIPNVTLILIDIIGFSELAGKTEAKNSVRLLNELVEAFDDAAARHHIEKVGTAGDVYFAACGLHNPVLDHAKRMMEFALDARKIMHGFNINHQLNLSISCSLNTGEVIAGVIGSDKFSYALWGPTVSRTFTMSFAQKSNSIIVSEPLFEKLNEFYRFSKQSTDSVKFPLDFNIRVLQEQEAAQKMSEISSQISVEKY